MASDVAEAAVVEGLFPTGWQPRKAGKFQPRARYYDTMDFVLYLREDLPYRADRVDEFLTLLWHPNEQRAVGVKLKGIRFLFNRLQAIMAPRGVTLADRDFLPLISMFEIVVSVKLGATLTAAAERFRLDDRYELARQIIDGASIDPKEVLSATA